MLLNKAINEFSAYTKYSRRHYLVVFLLIKNHLIIFTYRLSIRSAMSVINKINILSSIVGLFFHGAGNV